MKRLPHRRRSKRSRMSDDERMYAYVVIAFLVYTIVVTVVMAIKSAIE